MPVHAGLSGDWADLAYRTGKRGRTRMIRTVYEIRAFEALCDQLKCKGVWVAGAMEFRDPDEDLPATSPSAAPSTTGRCASRDEQELSVLCLRISQAAVVYLNMLMIQDVLDEGLPELGADDLRGLTPLFWTSIAPYGEVRLNMSTRLALRDTPSFPPASDPASKEQPR